MHTDSVMDVNEWTEIGIEEQWDQVSVDVKELLERARQDQWDVVVTAYEKKPHLQKATITKSEDTALHIAVSDEQTEVVFKLVEILGKDASNILKIKNDKGNTPLHLAAALGHVDICHCIASKDPSLIAERNNESETPLFSAALQGKKEAFLCLYHFSKEKEKDISCRNRNGDTVLHAAISRQYFSVAFQIIQCYPYLVHSVNESGLTPLHILASKPNAFQSSTRLRPLDDILYYCIPVDQLKKEKCDHKAHRKHSKSNTDRNYPHNYETCVTFFQFMKHSLGVFTKSQDERNDEENPEQKSSLSEGASSSAMKLETRDQTKESSELKKRLNNGKTLSKNEVGDQKIGVDQPYPPNFTTFFLFLNLTVKALLIILGIGQTGIWRMNKITEKKEKHTWANQIMNELVDRVSLYKYGDNGCNPKNSRTKKDDDFSVPEELPHTKDDDMHHGANTSTAIQDINGKGRSPNGADLGTQRAKEIQILETENAPPSGKKETPLLIAAKMGVAEMVEKILDTFPEAVYDLNSENKNIVLLAVENRQTSIYQLLLKRKILGESVFKQVDNEGNSALHLAATFGQYRPWLIPGAALQMQWEIKWYQFVKKSKPPHFFARYNNEGKTAKEIFANTHKDSRKDLAKEGREWLIKTSESCSVVAALVATVAYATSATIPGGVNEKSGHPVLEDAIPFNIFAFASLVALGFSVTALVFFLSILTSRYQEHDFANDLPRKLLLGLTCLFTSIASILISFCSGHFFILTERLRPAAYPIYVVSCLPVTIFALAQLPLYFDLFWAIFKKVPQRNYKVISP